MMSDWEEERRARWRRQSRIASFFDGARFGLLWCAGVFINSVPTIIGIGIAKLIGLLP